MWGGILMGSGCLAIRTGLKQPAVVTSSHELARGTVTAVCCGVVSVTCTSISWIVVSLGLFRKVRGRGVCLIRYY